MPHRGYIEDEPALSLRQKRAFSERWVEGRVAADPFARELGACLSSSTTEAERGLVVDAARVVDITHGFRARQRRALERCLRIMTRGMVEFQQQATLTGLQNLPHLDRYCYHVAGVVGETLTELFCDYSAEIDRRREQLLALSASFGQGLQMTNILKDIWGDLRRGACWLPRNVFRATGFGLRTLSPGEADPGFVAGLTELVAVTRHHLAEALRFILLIPAPRDRCPSAPAVDAVALRTDVATPPHDALVPQRSGGKAVAVEHTVGHPPDQP